MPTPDAPVFCLGADHLTTPLRILESLSAGDEDTAGFSLSVRDRLRRIVPEGELVVLSTCNRFEIYWTEGNAADLYAGFRGCGKGGSGRPVASAEQRVDGGEASIAGRLESSSRFLPDLSTVLVEYCRLTPDELATHLSFREGREALDHLLRVASGLESLVVGEYQILGQIEEAFSSAEGNGSCGPIMGAVLTEAVRCGRRARKETDIARNPRSVSTVAVQFAEKVLGEVAARRVVIAGSGEMGRLTLRALHHHGARSIDIVNRRLDRARALAGEWGAAAHPIEELAPLLAGADLLIASTASREPILTASAVAGAMARRPSRPLVLIDLAMPRDIEEAAGSLEGVHLFDLRSLKKVADSGESESRKAIPEVERIICAELDALRSELGALAIRPVLSDLWNFADSIREEVVRAAHHSVDGLSGEQWEEVERMTRVLTNKLMHRPSVLLRRETTNGRAVDYANLVSELFGLDGGLDDRLRDGRR